MKQNMFVHIISSGN